ncbi:MAG: ABC transporter substrate-binding protein [Oscillospiraceae bacterium]|nr:ABC transporter substrate-binding protein [Oscillospiraceae bacterium]
MKKLKAILCIVLALSMVLVFAACAKDSGSGDSGKKDDAGSSGSSSTQTDSGNSDSGSGSSASVAPAEDTSNIPQDQLPDPNMTSTALHMFSSLDEYYNRPHELVPGSSVHLLATNDVPSQVPWNATAETWMLPNIYEGLAYTYMGQVNDVRPLIAESYTHSDDYLTWTFQIRDGIKFSDGTVCDAPAVAKSWGFYQEASPTSFNNVNIVSYEATSDKEFVVYLSAPCSYFEVSLQTMYILSPTALEQYGINDNRSAIGTGPYYIDSYTAGVEFVFKARPDYYYYDRMPVIETVICSIINDATTKLMALANGEIDGYTFRALESYYYLIDNDFDGSLLISNGNADPVFLNAKTVPEFCHHEVREAMSRFIDFNAINDLLYDGMGLVQTSMWTVGSSGEVPFDGYYYNEAEGLELMAQAGVDPKSMSFVAKIIDTGKDLFVTIQGQLDKVGMSMEVQPLEPEANFTFLKNGDWTLTSGNSGYSDARPYLAWTYILLPEHLIKECWQDLYDPDLYEKMKDEYYAMTSAPTWEEMLDHAHRLTTYEQEDFGCLNGIQVPFFGAYSKNVKDVVFITENHTLPWYYLYLAD